MRKRIENVTWRNEGDRIVMRMNYKHYESDSIEIREDELAFLWDYFAHDPLAEPPTTCVEAIKRIARRELKPILACDLPYGVVRKRSIGFLIRDKKGYDEFVRPWDPYEK